MTTTAGGIAMVSRLVLPADGLACAGDCR